MKLNPQIKETFEQYNIPYDEGMLYLLAVYYNLHLSDAILTGMDVAIKQINISKIVERDYTNNDVKWNIPLFEGHETEWDWVLTEYRPIFKGINPDRAGSPSACVKRMKDFFKKHPEVRKSDVIDAVKAYVATIDDAKFLTQADYFIKKDGGVNERSKLEQFLERVKMQKEVTSIRDSNLKMM